MAMVDGQRLYDLNIELPSGERKKANIYKGQITRIEPSLEAAFVNYGGDRHGFLPLKEISSEYFVRDVASGSKANIKEVLKEGQDIVVQIDKEERGNKGAALTTFVSLAGRFIVLKPNKNRSGGVSRRIVGEERDLARDSLREVEVPDGMSVILRTAGIDRSAEELEWDLNNLLSVWEAIKSVVVERPSPFLIYRESNAVVRALRDYLTNDIGEILIDDEATYTEALEFVTQVMPHNQRKLKHYSDPVPLFTRYQIESQIETAFSHLVTLPSGGSLVIDHTEALVSIDINSARATKGSDIEATALNTNLEAADEIARQLRLRDLGGLIVIDFIDMGPQRNQRDVENCLREAVRQDRARVQIGKITRFGLLEMSRQRLRPSLGESSYLVCPRCSGIGNIRSVESLALAILRIIGEECRKERTAKVVAQLPVEVATYLLNEKRDWVQNLESRNNTQVIMVANSALETPHYQVRRIRDDQVELPENTGLSYMLADTPDVDELPPELQEPKPAEVAAVTATVPVTPAPPRREPEVVKGPGLWARMVAFFGSSSTEDTKQSKSRPAAKRGSRDESDSRRRGGQRKRRGSGETPRTTENRAPQRAKKPSKKRTKRGEKKGPEARSNEPADQADKKADAQPQPGELAGTGEEPRKAGSKRRSRGGRRRRRSPDSADATNGADQQADNSTSESQVSPDAALDVAVGVAAVTAATSKPQDGGPDKDANAQQMAATNNDAAAESAVDTTTTAAAKTPDELPPQAAGVEDSGTGESQAATTAATAQKTTRPAAELAAEELPAAQSDKKDEPFSNEAQHEAEHKPTREESAAEQATAVATADYEDTQPELPVLQMKPQDDISAVAEEPSASVSASGAPVEEAVAVVDSVAVAEPVADDEPERVAEPVAAVEPEAAVDATPIAKTAANGDGDDKPLGRLLPWEPVEPVESAPVEAQPEEPKPVEKNRELDP